MRETRLPRTAALRLAGQRRKRRRLNGHVERAHRTHNEEFYEVTPDRWNLLEVNRQLLAWERTYNTIRPHQALAYATPLEFLQRHHQSKSQIQKCH